MAKTRKQKEEIVGKLESALKGLSSVFVGFTGISVAQETAMRRSLRAEGLGYAVAKKTLLRRALKNAGLEGEVTLPGEVAIAFTSASADATAPARRVHAASKEFGAERISILGGIFEGRVINAAEMAEIATIPGLETLRGMFANIINSPRARFALALGEVAKTKSA